ncbi:MAG: hypothetical protein U1C74_19315 [Phenylobacterium sp.]|nr:hypothetical protein [Phenylobacterium sp.]
MRGDRAPPLFVEGMKGLGDNIYQRPFVAAACRDRRVWISTPWPEIYADLPVRFVRTGTTLRTQAANEARQPAGLWTRPPGNAVRARPFYAGRELRAGSIPTAMARAFRHAGPVTWDLPDMGPSPVTSDKPIAVIRPVTVRSEWRNESRNPRPEYLRWISRALLASHHVVVLAHLKSGQEWLAGELPHHHQALTAGELDVRQMLALVRDADLVVGGVGWIVPAAIALKTRAFIVLGGQGGHNAPERITAPGMDLGRIGWATPKAYCRCEDMRHPCNKLIPDLAQQWAAFRAETDA